MAKGMGHLEYFERELIAELRFEGESIGYIAELLGRSKSTISDELSRNSRDGRYNPCVAEALARRRQAKPRVPDKMDCPEIRAYVEKGLKNQWSPEQISGRMRLDFPSSLGMRISHERIYLWVWEDKADGGLWYKELRHGSKPRRRRCGRGKRTVIRNRVGIEERPISVDLRHFVGDWEGDTVLGGVGKGLFASWLERKTGFYCLAPMPDKSAASLNRSIIERFSENPELPIRTITLDNGTEFAAHEKLSQALNAKVFFAHPYSAWERGANENANGLLRQYFPKGMDLRKIPQERIAEVENLLNNRPRKRLNYRTPAEAMKKLTRHATGVRIGN